MSCYYFHKQAPKATHLYCSVLHALPSGCMPAVMDSFEQNVGVLRRVCALRQSVSGNYQTQIGNTVAQYITKVCRPCMLLGQLVLVVL